MQAQCAFCRFCFDDDGGKKYVGNGKQHEWECVDADACFERQTARKSGEAIPNASPTPT
jgi:hypothetical protein